MTLQTLLSVIRDGKIPLLKRTSEESEVCNQPLHIYNSTMFLQIELSSRKQMI